jgi:hypothetical protein
VFVGVGVFLGVRGSCLPPGRASYVRKLCGIDIAAGAVSRRAPLVALRVAPTTRHSLLSRATVLKSPYERSPM